jgi:hypothetical protein
MDYFFRMNCVCNVCYKGRIAVKPTGSRYILRTCTAARTYLSGRFTVYLSALCSGVLAVLHAGLLSAVRCLYLPCCCFPGCFMFYVLLS